MLPRASLLEPQSPLSTGGGSQSLSFFLFCRLSSWVVRQAGGFDFVSAEKGNSLYGLRELGNPLSDPPRCSPPPHLRFWTHHHHPSPEKEDTSRLSPPPLHRLPPKDQAP